MKILQKKVIIPAVIVLVLILILIVSFGGKSKTKEEIVQVKTDTVVQKISESGIIKKGERLEIGFEISGILKEVLAKTGQAIKRGDILGKLDNTQLVIQYNQAKADYALAKSLYDKLVAGATAQDIQIAQTTLDKALKAWEDSKTSLDNTKQVSLQTLNSYYSLGISHLQATKIQLFDALAFIEELQRDYFYAGDQTSIAVKNKTTQARQEYVAVESALQDLNANFSQEKADIKFVEAKNNIYIFSGIFDFVKEKAQETPYKDLVSITEKTSLDAHRSYISADYSTIVSDISTITLKKSVETQTINTAQAAADQAYYTYQSAKEALEKLKTTARVEDLAYYQAQVDKARESVDYLQTQLSKASAKSPQDGIVVEVKKEAGELVQALTPVFYILPDTTYYIEADIYEEDVPKISIGNKTEIELVAYPLKTFEGEVAFIEPGEKVINDVVYYPVKVVFTTTPDVEIKSGMSADISIISQVKENILVVPVEAVNKIDNKDYVFVKTAKRLEQREIKTGLFGTNGLVEVLAGLSLGENIVIK